MDDIFKSFLDTVDGRFQGFVIEINDYLITNNCTRSIKSAKSGYIVSYLLDDTKRTLATFVFRKTGAKLRIYPEHISQYESFLDTLPEKMINEIKKSSVCKRLLNPDDCNPKCVMGYSFHIYNQDFQKCRYMAFMPTLSEENNPFIKQFLEKEICAR